MSREPRFEMLHRSELGVVDAGAALERIGGDRKLYRELAAIFIEDSPSLVEGFRASIAAGDTKRAEHQAHALKGIAANVGGARVEAIARQVEQLLHGGQGELVSAYEQCLVGELQLLIAALAAQIKNSRQDAD